MPHPQAKGRRGAGGLETQILHEGRGALRPQLDDVGLLRGEIPENRWRGIGRVIESRQNMTRPDVLGGSPLLPLGWNRLGLRLPLEHVGLPCFIVRMHVSGTIPHRCGKSSRLCTAVVNGTGQGWSAYCSSRRPCWHGGQRGAPWARGISCPSPPRFPGGYISHGSLPCSLPGSRTSPARP